MKASHWLASAAAALVLTGGAAACIEALDLGKMVAKTDTAVQGTITEVRTTSYTPPGDHPLIYTIITVEGVDLYTNEARTLEAAFLGGIHQGQEFLVTSMPHPSEYAVGNDVVVFSGEVEGWGPEIDRCVYAAMGGIFRQIGTPNGTVVLGKGEGFAVEKNMTIESLQAGIANALAAKKEVK